MFNEELESLKKRIERLEKNNAIGIWYNPDADTRLLSKAHKNDAGWDICSTTDITILPSERCAVPTGIHR